MPRILFSDSSESWGGLQYWMRSVASGLQSRGWETALFVSGEIEQVLGVTPAPQRMEDFFDESRKPEAISRSHKVSHYNLVVAGTGQDIRSLGLSARLHRVPLVWSVGGMPQFTWLHSLTRDPLVAHVLVPSQYARGLMMEAGWEPHEVTAVANGIPLLPAPTPDEVTSARHSLGWKADEFVILFVGSLRRVKRVDVLLDAFAQVADSLPAARVVLVGAGPKRPALEEQIARLGLADRVEFAGFQRDPSPYFTACDLFVLPSREETFGLVLLEAMMRGKPIVASGAGAIPEVVGLDEAAVLVDTSTPEPLAHAIARVVQDSSLRQKLADAGPRRVKERFTEEMMLDQLDAYFRSLLR